MSRTLHVNPGNEYGHLKKEVHPGAFSAAFAGAFLAERPPMRAWIGILMVGADLFVLAFKR